MYFIFRNKILFKSASITVNKYFKKKKKSI